MDAKLVLRLEELAHYDVRAREILKIYEIHKDVNILKATLRSSREDLYSYLIKVVIRDGPN